MVRKIFIFFGWVICLGLMVAGPTVHASDWILYDDFGNNAIDPNKWWINSTGSYNAETVAYESFRGLHLYRRSYGNPTQNTGASDSRLQAQLTNTNVRGVMADIEILESELRACPDNLNGSVQTRICAMFFNAGTSEPNGCENDIWAGIQVTRPFNSSDPPGVFSAFLYVTLCTDAPCNQYTMVGSAELGKFSLGQKARLRLEWDPEGKRIIGQVNDELEQSIPYQFEETRPAACPTKRIEVRNIVSNGQCEFRPSGMIHSIVEKAWVLMDDN